MGFKLFFKCIVIEFLEILNKIFFYFRTRLSDMLVNFNIFHNYFFTNFKILKLLKFFILVSRYHIILFLAWYFSES